MTAGRLLVKICGVTTPEDAAVVVAAGADLIGVNFWSGSKRHVTLEAARDILAPVPAGVLKVGVFVDATLGEVERHVDALGLDRAQLHGDESPGQFDRLDGRLIRVVRVRDESSFAGETGWSPALWLYDAFVDGYGGGGVPAPWSLIGARARRPFLIAGGLTPDNVAAAIRATKSDGVDVASGVESSARKKDPAKVAAFIKAARGAGPS